MKVEWHSGMCVDGCGRKNVLLLLSIYDLLPGGRAQPGCQHLCLRLPTQSSTLLLLNLDRIVTRYPPV